MSPAVFLSPALKAALSTVAPWLAGAAILGGVAGFQVTTNARLKSRLALLEKANRSAVTEAPATSDREDAHAPEEAVTSDPAETAETADISSKSSLLRRIMESNVRLRKQHTE
jgi:hypothetical protein